MFINVLSNQFCLSFGLFLLINESIKNSDGSLEKKTHLVMIFHTRIGFEKMN